MVVTLGCQQEASRANPKDMCSARIQCSNLCRHMQNCKSKGTGTNDSCTAPDSDFDDALGKATEEVEVELDDHEADEVFAVAESLEMWEERVNN